MPCLSAAPAQAQLALNPEVLTVRSSVLPVRTNPRAGETIFTCILSAPGCIIISPSLIDGLGLPPAAVVVPLLQAAATKASVAIAARHRRTLGGVANMRHLPTTSARTSNEKEGSATGRAIPSCRRAIPSCVRTLRTRQPVEATERPMTG